MAINLTTNYSKKLGLPGYSSHAFSASIEVEIDTSADIPAEIAHLYALLQGNVDEQIQAPGFIPPGNYGMDESKPGKVSATPSNVVKMDAGWKCSTKQRELIEKVVNERGIDKREVEDLASDRFGKGVKDLNKLEASGLIGLLFDQFPATPQRRQQRGGR